MKIYGAEVAEGSEITNLTVKTGTGDPSNPNSGELFFRTDTGKLRIYNGTSWLDINTGTAGGVSTFIDLTDTPSSFTGNGSYLLRVNSGATAVEFVDGTGLFASSSHDHSGTYQPVDADLTAIAGLSGTSGLLKKTAADMWTLDTNTYSTTNHEHASTYQPLDAQLTDIAGLSPTKGNVIVGDGTNFIALGVGTNNYVLTADSAQTSGVKWATVTATGDTSPTPNTLAQRDASGDLYAVNFVSSSDETLKKDIRPIENALDIVNNLEGKRFKFINNEREQVGFIAQQIEKVLPEVVETGADGRKFVGYANITAVLAEAIKEQNKKIEELQQLVKSLMENTTEDK